MRLLITGRNGQLGSELVALCQQQSIKFIATTINELDLSQEDSIKSFFKNYRQEFDVVINTGAYTAVDNAEKEFEKADAVNNLAVAELVKQCKESNKKFVHISTDYVFDGENFRPYLENDITNPQSVYGKTKLDGELQIVDSYIENSIIIRTSWLYSSLGNNFVKTMLKIGSQRDELNVIFDQVGTPTYAQDLARAILEIVPQLDNTQTQIYNYSNEGVTSWYDFAKVIFEIAHINCCVSPILTEEYPTPAQRPHYSILNKNKIKQDFGIIIPYWKDSLRKCIDEITAT